MGSKSNSPSKLSGEAWNPERELNCVARLLWIQLNCVVAMADLDLMCQELIMFLSGRRCVVDELVSIAVSKSRTAVECATSRASNPKRVGIAGSALWARSI